MSVRLTKKKKKQMLFDLDRIIMHHRVRLFQRLTDRIDQTTADTVQDILREMNAEVVTAMATHFDELLTAEPPVLPFNLSDNDL